jgi:NifU-like protein involved in Fe-S cluster formation
MKKDLRRLVDRGGRLKPPLELRLVALHQLLSAAAQALQVLRPNNIYERRRGEKRPQRLELCRIPSTFTFKRANTSMADLEDIYSEKVLMLSGNIPRTGRLPNPDATASAHSKLCGSRITVDLQMKDGIVTDFAQDVRACLLGQTSAAVMGANIVGSPASELRTVGAQMRRMLKEGAAAPAGRWSDLAILESVRDYKARHASTLLVFDAVEEAIAEIELKRP